MSKEIRKKETEFCVFASPVSFLTLHIYLETTLGVPALRLGNTLYSICTSAVLSAGGSIIVCLRLSQCVCLKLRPS